MSAATAPLEDRRLFGILLILAAFLLFAGVDTSAKWLVTRDIPAMEVVFVRYAGHLAWVLALLAPREGLAIIRSRSPKWEVVRAIALMSGTIANFYAVRYLPLTVTAALFFTVPIWVCVLSIPMLGERVGLRRWAAVAVGFAGILIVIRPWNAEAHWAVILALGTALAASLYSIFTRRLSGVDSAATQQFYAAATATMLVAPFSFAAWVWPTAPSDIFAFVAIGGFAWAGHQLMTIAHRFAPASVLAPFTYVAIIYLTASSWMIFGDVPDLWVFVGAAVVVASGLYIWLRERRLASPPAAAKARTFDPRT